MFEKMHTHNYSLPKVSSLIQSSCLCSEYQDSLNEHMADPPDVFDENMCDFEDLEVFSDHLLMGERLRKTLYAGRLEDLEDFPENPPIALTGLALEFFSKAVPNYGLDILDMDYVSNTSEATRVPPCAMIIAMIYLERLQLQNSEYLETVSPPGLFVVTMLVASKFLFEDEDMVSNQMWSEALNFDVKELNELEKDFLSAIDWKVFVHDTEYMNYLNHIEKVIALKQSSFRNWLSYTDLSVIMQDPNFCNKWKDFVKRIVKATLLWALGYAATALALHCTSLSVNKIISRTTPSKNLQSLRNQVDLNNNVNMPEVEKYLVMETLDEDTLIAFETSDLTPDNIQNNNYCSPCLACKTSHERLSSDTHSSHGFRTILGDNVSGNNSRTNNTFSDTVSWLRINDRSCISVLVR